MLEIQVYVLYGAPVAQREAHQAVHRRSGALYVALVPFGEVHPLDPVEHRPLNVCSPPNEELVHVVVLLEQSHRGVKRVAADAVAVYDAVVRHVSDAGAVGGGYVPDSADREHVRRQRGLRPARRYDHMNAAFRRRLKGLPRPRGEPAGRVQGRPVQVQRHQPYVMVFHKMPLPPHFISIMSMNSLFILLTNFMLHGSPWPG